MSEVGNMFRYKDETIQLTHAIWICLVDNDYLLRFSPDGVFTVSVTASYVRRNMDHIECVNELL